MTLALVATPKPAFGSVLLEVTGAADGAATITRSDHNGVSTVRLMPDQEPIAGDMTVFDHEASLGGTIDYTVTDAASVVASASVTLGVLFPILSCAVLPDSQVQLVAVTDYDATRDYAGNTHEVIDRQDPIVTPSRLRFRSGSLTAWCGTYEDALATVAVADSGEVLLLRQPTFRGMDMYIVPRSVAMRPSSQVTDARRWEVTVSYTEVASPSGPLLSAVGWTWDVLAESYASWDDVETAFASWNAVAAGP